MAYVSKNLSVLAYSNGFTLWHYTTTDTATTVDTSGYFNSAADMVRVGDMILANTDTGNSYATGIFVVASNGNGVVDVANMTQVNSSNTD